MEANPKNPKGETQNTTPMPQRKTKRRKQENPIGQIQWRLVYWATTLTGNEGVATPSFSSMFLGKQRFDLLHLGGKKGLHVLALAVKLM